MDILISSNLERLLYRISGEDDKKDAGLMEALASGGRYAISEEMKGELADFYGNFATMEETAKEISDVYRNPATSWIPIRRWLLPCIRNT